MTVVVVGAGPVGLMLAGELARGGVHTVVLERLGSPMTESRASQLTTRTAELLVERGLGALVDEAVFEPGGHFGGIPFDQSVVDSPFAGNWKVPQHRTEAVLARRAVELGVEIRRGDELVSLTDNGDHVLCNGSLPASYVVGCDGAASTVRRLAEFEVVSGMATRQLLRADVTGLDIAERRFERFPKGMAVAMTRNGVTRVMVHGFDHWSTVNFGSVVALWAEITGEDISGGTPVWVDAFTDEWGQAVHYRRGRVLLAGDAARWHMPIGGQALNAGLQDAVNLGWKLAAAEHGWAPDGLLDTYHTERHAAGARVLANVRTQEQVLLGDGPLRSMFTELLELPEVRAHFAMVAAGLDVRCQ